MIGLPPPVMKDAVLPANLDTNHSPCNLGPTSVYNSPEPLFPDSQYPPKLKAASIQCDNVKSALFPESQDPANLKVPPSIQCDIDQSVCDSAGNQQLQTYTQKLADQPHLKYSSIGAWFEDNADGDDEKDMPDSCIFKPDEVCETVLDNYSCKELHTQEIATPISSLVCARLPPDVTQRNEGTNACSCVHYLIVLEQLSCLICFLLLFVCFRNCIREAIYTTAVSA